MTLQGHSAEKLLLYALSVLLIDQLDNIGTMVFASWMRVNHNKLVRRKDFMVISSNEQIESTLVYIYLLLLSTYCFNIFLSDSYLENYIEDALKIDMKAGDRE